MAMAKAKRGNQTIDALADGASPLTETSEIPRCLDSWFLAASLEYLQAPLGMDLVKVCVKAA
jgi:hypothetical protein